ncbi:MAG: NTP transferase domain-containing protein [Nitrospinae bacterium]|nr:NTP transferase domain-containing protein [Nitrospinota bacterium]MDA1108925.1 NTP transferase domain-containing protein [Nitrospinota bacterium]
MTENFIAGKTQKGSKKCLIIAAGKGMRLRSRGASKPLTPIFGIPLIERVVMTAMEAGANEFFVVTGYQADALQAFLQDLSHRLGIRITPIANEDWEKENGLSVLKGQPYFQEPFLLLMADHLFDPAIARDLMSYPLGDKEIALGVDRNTSNPLIDLQDVTRVKTADDNILAIGKGIKDFDAFDTGIFYCQPALFNALEQCSKENGDTTLSGAIQILARDNRAKAVDIANRFWIDVDDPNAFKLAENALLSEIEDSASTVVVPSKSAAEPSRKN